MDDRGIGRYIDGFRWNLGTGVDRYLFRTVRKVTGEQVPPLAQPIGAGGDDQMTGQLRDCMSERSGSQLVATQRSW
jgi:hypothetical protein